VPARSQPEAKDVSSNTPTDNTQRDAIAPPDVCTFVNRLTKEATVICEGEIDVGSLTMLRRALTEAMDQAPDRVVVDLSGVSFFDCSAIGAFVDARTAMRASGRDLALWSPTAFGRRVLEIVGLADLETDAPPAFFRPGTHDTEPDHQRVFEVLASWKTACETSAFRSEAVVFKSPFGLVSSITRLLDNPSPSLSPAVLADLVAAALLPDGTDPAVAVMQLMALNAVLHARFDTNANSDDHHERPRFEAHLQAAIGALVSELLVDLEAAGLLDPLTGLLNRRALDRDLVQVLAAARRHGQCLSVVMIDVEGLKATNDQFGHAAGDTTLRSVADNLVTAMRAGDNAYRIGGDEFVLVLPDLFPEDVDAVMQRTVVGARDSFTWGCAWVLGDDESGTDLEHARYLLDLADQRMLNYRSRIRAPGTGIAAGSTQPARGSVPAIELAGQLVGGNRGRIAIDQAMGVIAQHFGVRIEEASTILDAFSRRHDQTVASSARALIDGTVDPESLVAESELTSPIG